MTLLALPNHMPTVTKVNNTSGQNDILHNETCPHCSSEDTYQRKCDGKPYIVCDDCNAVFIRVNSSVINKINLLH